MKTPFEQIQNDEGSSFRLLHHKVTANEFSWSYHYHPEIELVLVFGGNGRCHVGNYLGYYEDGELVLIGSNLPHTGFGYDALGIHEEVVIQFREDFLGERFFTNPEMENIRKLFERSKQGIQFYGQTYAFVTKQLKEILALDGFRKLVRLLDVLEILANSKEYNLLNTKDSHYDFNYKDQLRLKRIYDYVEANYHQPIDLLAVAAVAHLTIPAFCNYFKKLVKLTFTDFVNEYRINKACQLLMTEKSMADICYECGFNNSSYFSKVFKQIKGKTPLEFKKMMRSN